jgi:uncharacterized membrane protein SpoIIM required for sporulation
MTRSFVESRRERWQRLYDLLRKAEKSKLTAFTPQELIEFSVLYRQAATDLAAAETHDLPDDIRDFLNDLTGRAYHHLYRNKRISLPKVKSFLVYDFPRLIRENKLIVLFSFGLLLTGMLIGFFARLWRPELLAGLFPLEFLHGFVEKYREDSWFTNPWSFRPLLSSLLLTNNLQVLIMTFAGGMLCGVLTVYILVLNGLLLGALAGEFFRAGLFLSFWAMILPHGVIELTAFTLSGAAGLCLARALLFPGDYRRQDVLRLHGKTAAKLLTGALFLIFIAGLIEGYLSTTSTQVIPEWGRLLFAAATALLLLFYFCYRPARSGQSGEEQL